MTLSSPPLHISIFLPLLSRGGISIGRLQLARELAARGHQVELILGKVRINDGRLAPPPGVTVVHLQKSRTLPTRLAAMRAAGRDWRLLLRPVLMRRRTTWALRYLPPLAVYLAQRKPDVLLSANSWPNLVAIWASCLVDGETRVVVSEHTQLSEKIQRRSDQAHWRWLPQLIGHFYTKASQVVAVSNGLADDLASVTQLERSRIAFIPNPVLSGALNEKAVAPCPHPWLNRGGPPVILGVGRLNPQKDFESLLHAFALVRQRRPVRLIILGEGSERSKLETLVQSLDLASDVALTGFDNNPFAYMSRADVFALSSSYEGLGMVLIEAMALGCASVSTDCPSGPREILQDGKLGPLVQVGDIEGLAQGIEKCLDDPVSPEVLRRATQPFNVTNSADAYLEVLSGARNAPQKQTPQQAR